MLNNEEDDDSDGGHYKSCCKVEEVTVLAENNIPLRGMSLPGGWVISAGCLAILPAPTPI